MGREAGALPVMCTAAGVSCVQCQAHGAATLLPLAKQSSPTQTTPLHALERPAL